MNMRRGKNFGLGLVEGGIAAVGISRQGATVSRQAKILIVDDTPKNLKLFIDLLEYQGYAIVTATSGAEALAQVEKERPDLVLLDVVMPGMTGYEVCRKIREDPETSVLPVVMVTALDPNQERVHGLEAGADDFLTKPINHAELLARVRPLLRIKELYDTIRSQAAQLAEWNQTLEKRVGEQVAQLERLGRLKRFLSPQLAELIVREGTEDALKIHRRDVTVVFIDLRDFSAFAETAEPEEVMTVLGEYQREMGWLIQEHEGTLERFAGDGMMIFFNDPFEVSNPEERAVRMALAMRDRVAALGATWSKRGYNLSLGVGIGSGFATIGAIGFEERWDYGVIGTVTNLAARLCAEAGAGQILITQRVRWKLENLVEVEEVGELKLKGFQRPVVTYNVIRLA